MDRKTHRVYKVEPSLWKELNLDDPEVYERVRNALYIGLGLFEIKRIAHLRADHFDVLELNRVAPMMGVTEEDRITQR